ncbi:Pre-mRNA splicing factor-domain-containing protein [Sporodiniella umbellata]|nr:Pre-mRNA splicing factor-domain-containing protein [Sporodiniella umbellata]
MGSSDLNLKKSWHPSTFKNQERVWKEEQKRKEEDRKLEQLKKELAEERQLQDLQQMQEDAGTKQKSNKLDWMYAGPNANINSGTNDHSMEEFLLGKKNVDDLLRMKQREQVRAATDLEESRFTLSNSNANNERDIQAKIREDPLLMIKKREQMALKAIMENPIRLKELKKREKKDKRKREKKKEERRKREQGRR